MDETLYIGSNGHVCAIDPKSGTQLWRRRLQEGMLNATNSADVSVIVRAGVIYAGCQGHLFALGAGDGRILWHNEMPGLGYNDVSLALEGQSVQYLQKVERRDSSSSN